MLKLFASVSCPVALVADGTSSAVLFDLEQAPFSMRFEGRLPTGIYSVASFGPDAPAASATIEGTVVTLTFASPPPAGSYVGNVMLTY